MGEIFETAAVWFPADRLVFWDQNANKHPERQLAKLRASFVANGWGDSATAQAGTSRLISGHGRVIAVRQLLEEDPTWALPGSPGPGLVPVRFVDLPWEQCVRLGIASNEIARGAKIDEDILAGLLRADELDRVALAAATGIDDRALRKLLAEPTWHATAAPEADPGPPSSVVGAVYELGPHRLVCGSATDRAIWDLVLDGAMPDLVLTDPPYGVGDTKSTKNNYSQHDDTRDALVALVAGFVPIARAVCDLVVLTPGNGNVHIYPVPTWTMAWVTPAGAGRGPWGFCCWQPVLCYGSDPKLKGGLGCFPDAVVRTESADKSLAHPCPKPIGLWSWLLERCSPADVICDPFGGSGTTLIAAAALGRVCKTIEIDPAYCDVIRHRWWLWCQESGQDAGPDALAAVT